VIAFLTVVYVAFVAVLFKFKLVKPRPLPIVLVVFAGVLLIGGVFVVWMQCSPLSGRVVTTQYVVQLVPYVKGQVKKVVAQPNQPIKKGDLLLEIDPEPYQYKVDQLQAQTLSAQNNVKQAGASLEAAKASVVTAGAGVKQAQAALDQALAAVAGARAAVDKAKASDDLAKTEEKIALNLQKTDAGAISVLKVVQAQQNREGADAALEQSKTGVTQAQAAQQQAAAALESAKSAQRQSEAAARQSAFALEVAESNVPAVQAQLGDARFNLAECRITAPADGYVVNWQVQEGTMLVPMPMAAAGTFICTSDTAVVASFPQNYLTNVRRGDQVELVLDPYPGRLFKGQVDSVLTATGEGQYDVSGNIPVAAKVGSQGFLAVKIRLTGEPPANLPLGAGGTAAVYTAYGKPVHIISKVTIRMKKWLLYVLPSS
jgi:membrane fusion protein (multidrug efflux system)